MTPSKLDGSSLADQRQKALRRLAELFAIRARELSEAVAGLGTQIAVGNSLDDAIVEINRVSTLCEAAASDFFDLMPLPIARSAVASVDGNGAETEPANLRRAG
jgi:hypothetical protein